MSDRLPPFQAIDNFRDYGGYAVEGGGRLRDGMLWRSAHHEAGYVYAVACEPLHAAAHGRVGSIMTRNTKVH